MAEANEKKDSYPRVAEFYDGKSIFLTGAAGFLGVVLLETLLELCPGIKSIYILLREKKGVLPEERKEEIFGRVVFDKLKQEMPEVLEKVQVVIGDVSKPYLGMNDVDLQEVADNVSIVFHCAACVNFLKPLKFALQQNVLGTQYAIDVCRKLKRLDAFVYTSTAYSNSNRKKIKETIYRLPFPAQTFLDELREGTDESLNRLVSEVHPPWPNFYTFSKSLAENFLQDNVSDLPVIIVRPSVICPIWKRPVPGYVTDNGGLSTFCTGVGKGFLKVVYGKPENVLDFISCDLAASTHVVAAWSVATRRSPSLHVINCTSSMSLTVHSICSLLTDLAKKWPFPKTLRKVTTIKITDNPVLYWVLAAYEHYIPAYMFDLFLKLSGSKIRLTRLYQFTDILTQSTAYFWKNSWHFHSENYQSLIKQLQVEDVKKFELEETVSEVPIIINSLPEGAPFYQWSIDKKSLPDRMKSANLRHWIANGFQILFLVCLLSLLYFIFTVTLAFMY